MSEEKEWKMVFERGEKDAVFYERATKDLTAGESGIKCLRCGAITVFQPCSNCGSTELGYRASAVICKRCKMSFSSLQCSCGCENPVAGDTLVKSKSGGCFIATTVYDDPFAKEVVLLKNFRDDYLSKSVLGRYFILTYYHISPYFANFISKSEILKKIFRNTILSPLVRRVKSILNTKI